MQSSSKTSEIDECKTSKNDKHNNRYKIPSNKNTGTNVQLQCLMFYVQSSDYWMLPPTPV